MLQRFSTNYAILSAMLDISLTVFAFALAAAIRTHLPVSTFVRPYAPLDIPTSLYVAISALWLLSFLLASAYDPRYVYRVVDELARVAFATGIAALLLAGLLFLSLRGLSRGLFVIFIVVDLMLLLGWRLLARITFRLHRYPATEQRVLIVGASTTALQVGNIIRQHSWMGLNLIGYLDHVPDQLSSNTDVLGSVKDARQVVLDKEITSVIIALPQEGYSQVNELITAVWDLPLSVRVIPDFFSVSLQKATTENFCGLPMINLRAPVLNDVQQLMKRSFDLVISGLFLLLVAPLLAAIAVAIKLDSPGPVIFRQRRIGENGVSFNILKFRTMVVAAEKQEKQMALQDGRGELLYKRPNDPRVTRVGGWLRRWSLDELPQLVNVLRGEMSLVGPRPELPWLVACYETEQYQRLTVPPGITGLWQVNGRATRPMHLHTEDDLFYIQNYSLLMDISILLKTPLVVLRGKGAF